MEPSQHDPVVWGSSPPRLTPHEPHQTLKHYLVIHRLKMVGLAIINLQNTFSSTLIKIPGQQGKWL